jgi:hypothetical protein
MEKAQEKAPGEKTDEEMEKEEEKKKKETPPESEETKTSSILRFSDALRATAQWVTKVAQGPVAFSEPATGGQTEAGGEMSVEPAVTGEQPHPTPQPMPEHDATAEKPLQADGTVGNTTNDPLTTQTQAEPGHSDAMETGKTNSGTTKSQPLAADAAKTGAYLRSLIKSAATPEDTAAAPAGQPAGADTTTSGGEVGGTEPTEQVPVVSGGDAAATNLTSQQAQSQTQVPDINPLLVEQATPNADSGQGTPNVDTKLSALNDRIRQALERSGY